MARALINLRDGTVELEGSEEFVSNHLDLIKEVMEGFQRDDAPRPDVQVSNEGSARESDRALDARSERREKKQTGEVKQIRERLSVLKGESFFDSPKSIREVHIEMRTRMWYHIPQNIQSALRDVELGIKRIQEGDRYKFVKV
ncbi:MAG: hypothetical protein ACE5KG_05740 [Nitrososphaerales archaeon]